MKQAIYKAIAGMAVIVAASGCSTMHFNNGPGQVRTDTQSEWHHTAVLSLWEVSSPVDMKQRCNGNDWTVVTTKRSFSNVVFGSVDNILLATKATGLDLWSPWTVEYSCK